MGDSWPVHGPSFNQWNGDIKAFGELIADAANEGWWCVDWDLKYIEIIVDTRDGGFVLFDRDRKLISPDRVVAAIQQWRAEHGKIKLRRAEP